MRMKTFSDGTYVNNLTTGIYLLYFVLCSFISLKNKGKDKVHPRTGHKGLEGEYMYSCTLSLTSALDGGAWSVQCPSHFNPRTIQPVACCCTDYTVLVPYLMSCICAF